MNYQIVPIAQQHIKAFNNAVGIVAREKKYLAFLDAPSLESTVDFVYRNIDADYPHLVVMADEELVGWCDIIPYIQEASSHVGVLGIGLLPEYRGMGIGKELMLSTIAKAQNKGITRVELSVREHNQNAIALYKKLGFVQEGISRNAIKIDGLYEDTIEMALILS